MFSAAQMVHLDTLVELSDMKALIRIELDDYAPLQSL